MAKPVKPVQNSRVWKDTQGFKFLVQWSNLVLLRYLIRLVTADLPKSEYRRINQLNDAIRSAIRNLEEGWKRATTSEYLEFLGFSQGSLEEVHGDTRELAEDGFLPSKPGSSLADLGIDLKEFNGKLKETRGSYDYIPLNLLYNPLKSLKSTDITFEMLHEFINKFESFACKRSFQASLINKTDYLEDQKYYQVDQARIKDKIK
ncbi:hypothetical protein COT44_05020 [Candidatus Shapirobacteria bacterium CG08_land_8_20_14_0_20_39_18]|uniref:Four helix bundle protein n=1 Tax=Candidatus Shapirobacteria bacterium CG08_land_8_20_14_0_20_39_18 TaxID=1974883 RepID=A0A2M6XBQ6_9BACT|nr:MAG: hypothetical protein COT44_05020 [Candidatus Shapirobacteria bacterium CG08_land_8_20_14_0_20_39_18]PIY64898.1 MAG: hypothetical protein COY91_04065 [Candidatus Shapirobacteria bacterium CG_4_10_14_0_8_um_filter_39_15]PJE68450.1 MAG: hypothetical protein COU94_01775 [Candidatus Shapirobacteria bacterium CG10_big_fil_rev_8_21_14_0_10_38_8]